MQIYLIVHGQTEFSLKGVRSSPDDSLTEKGIYQAKKVISGLKNSRKFSAIYSSDLHRAMQVAEIAKSILNIPVIQTAALREFDYGDLVGKPRESVSNFSRQSKDEVMDILKKFPNGESFYDMQRRVMDFISNLNANNFAEEYIFITHTGTVRAINDYYGHHPIFNALQRTIRPEYVGVYRLDQFNQSSSYDEIGNYE